MMLPLYKRTAFSFLLILSALLLSPVKLFASHLRRGNQIYYQIFVDTFNDGDRYDAAGDFKGIIQKIPYLKLLGVNGVILMPIHDSIGNGYVPNDYFSIRNSYGNSQDQQDKIENFKKLITELKKNDLEIFLDAPINQMTTSSPWYKNHPDYFMIADAPLPGWRIPWEMNSGPEDVWYFDDLNNRYYYALFGPDLVELNYHNQQVKNEIKRYFDYWSDLGVDGFRIDAAKHLLEGENNLDPRYPPNAKLIAELLSETQQKNSQIDFILEVWDSRETIDFYLKNVPGAAAFDIPYMESLRESLKSSSAYTVRDELNRLAQAQDHLPHSARVITLGNHDIQRIRTASGNDKRKVELSYALTFFLPFNKQLYYGDEIFMPGNLVRGENQDTPINEVLSPMAWDDTHNAGFTDERFDMGTDWNRKIHQDFKQYNVKSELPQPDSLLNLVKGMIHMQKDFSFSPQTKIYVDNYNTDQQVLKVTLQDAHHCALGFFNFSDVDINLPFTRLQGICPDVAIKEIYTRRGSLHEASSIKLGGYGFWIGDKQ